MTTSNDEERRRVIILCTILDYMYCICNFDLFKLILELEPVRIRSLTHSRIRRPSTLDLDPRPRPVVGLQI